AEAQTVVAEPVGVPPLIGRVGRLLDHALRAQRAQPRRQDVGGDPLRPAQELVEVPPAAQQVAHDQQRPAIADEVQRAGDGTVGATHLPRLLRALHHPTFYLRSASFAIQYLHSASDVAGAWFTARAPSVTPLQARAGDHHLGRRKEPDMSDTPILVTGAAGGQQGSPGNWVARFLLERGLPVRAFVHRIHQRSDELSALGAEVVQGDLLDIASVRRATAGVRRAYFVYPVRPGYLEATATFARAAKDP